MEKIPAVLIQIVRAEGPSAECGKVHFVMGANIWTLAHGVLMQMSESAPREIGYDKVDFLVTFEDGETYQGRCDIRHWTCEDPDLDIAEHILSFLRWHAGKTVDPWCGEEEYQKYLKELGQESVDECLRWLDTYQIGDPKSSEHDIIVSTPVPSA